MQKFKGYAQFLYNCTFAQMYGIIDIKFNSSNGPQPEGMCKPH